MTKKATQSALTGISILANAAALFHGTPASAEPALSPPNLDRPSQINTATKATMEASWLQVPHICKAKGFAFDPIQVGFEPTSADVLAIHSTLDA